jgi:hypothetical protein
MLPVPQAGAQIWLDGYTSQKVCIMDDWGKLTADRLFPLQRMLDGKANNPLIMPRKGVDGGAVVRWRMFVIISNFSPEEFVSDVHQPPANTDTHGSGVQVTSKSKHIDCAPLLDRILAGTVQRMTGINYRQLQPKLLPSVFHSEFQSTSLPPTPEVSDDETEHTS